MGFGIDDILGQGLAIINKFIPDTNARAAAEEALKQAAQDAYNAGLAANAEANIEEARHPSLFVAGWRPAIGWVCALVLFTWYVPMALVSMALWAYACWKTGGTIVARPDIGIAEIAGLVLSMLGIGGLRTIEKIKGVETSSVVGNRANSGKK